MAITYDISEINGAFSRDGAGFIAYCEDAFHQRVHDAAVSVLASGSRILMLAGPSSSGKTTTASIISRVIADKGGKAYVVSLDDFYLDKGSGPKRPDGSDDYESVYALDLPCLTGCLSQLVSDGRASLPVFDFTVGRRSAQTRDIVLNDKDMIIIEGLHALNPAVTDGLSSDALCRAYISVSSRVTDGGSVCLSKRELRFIRRMIRDYNFRASSPENTFALWRNVLLGEDEYLFPFRDRAQIRINSFHPYEPCVFAARASELLRTVSSESPCSRNARKLLMKLSAFCPVPESIVPENSLLREFIGN